MSSNHPKVARSWRALRQLASRADPPYESLAPQGWTPLSYYLGNRAPKVVLLFTKPYLLRQWLEASALPEDVHAVVHYGLPSKAVFKHLDRSLLPLRARLVFVGDLDPMDLSVYLEYRRRTQLAPVFGGIDDQWLQLCERWPRGDHSLRRSMIAMEPVERSHMALVRQHVPELDRLVGARAAAVLSSGYKIELEGATNPDLYEKPLAPALLHYLKKKVLQNERTLRPQTRARHRRER